MDLDFLYDGIVILDGAMGTVLQQKGLPPGGKPELLNFTQPDLLRSVYREYIDAGSHIIYANTFGASAPKLAGCGYTVDEVVSAAIAIAKEAAAGTQVRGPSLGPETQKAGFYVTVKSSGEIIFFPALGYRTGTTATTASDGTYANYWLAHAMTTLKSGAIVDFLTTSTEIIAHQTTDPLFHGMCIRGIKE